MAQRPKVSYKDFTFSRREDPRVMCRCISDFGETAMLGGFVVQGQRAEVTYMPSGVKRDRENDVQFWDFYPLGRTDAPIVRLFND